MLYSYTKKTVTKTTGGDGKTVVEETVETCTGPEAQAKAAEHDKEFGKMDRFFAKLTEAFKELF